MHTREITRTCTPVFERAFKEPGPRRETSWSTEFPPAHDRFGRGCRTFYKPGDMESKSSSPISARGRDSTTPGRGCQPSQDLEKDAAMVLQIQFETETLGQRTETMVLKGLIDSSSIYHCVPTGGCRLEKKSSHEVCATFTG